MTQKPPRQSPGSAADDMPTCHEPARRRGARRSLGSWSAVALVCAAASFAAAPRAAAATDTAPATGVAEHSRAQRLLASGRTEAAIGAWRNAVAASPRDIEILATAGASLYASGRFDEAASPLGQAAALAPTDWPLRLLHARSLTLAGQDEAGRKAFDAILAEPAGESIHQIARAMRDGSTKFGDPALVHPEIAQASGVQAQPGTNWIAVVHDLHWAKDGDADGPTVAMVAAQLSLSRFAGHPSLVPSLGPGMAIANARSPHYAGGLFSIYFGRSAMVTSIRYAARRVLLIVRAWRGGESEAGPERLRAVADTFSFMLDTLRVAGRKPEDELLIATSRGTVQADAGRFGEAADFYRYALQRLPSNPQARTLLAGAYLAMANADSGKAAEAAQAVRYDANVRRAEAELSQALQQWPEFAPALLNLSLVRSLQGRRKEAIALAERAVASRPWLWQGHGNLSCLHREAGDAAAAAEAFSKLEEAAPDQVARYRKCIDGLR